MSDTIRHCERVTITRVTTTEGQGVEGDPVRIVRYWYDDDGELIARHDPSKPEAVHASCDTCGKYLGQMRWPPSGPGLKCTDHPESVVRTSAATP